MPFCQHSAWLSMNPVKKEKILKKGSRARLVSSDLVNETYQGPVASDFSRNSKRDNMGKKRSLGMCFQCLIEFHQ